MFPVLVVQLPVVLIDRKIDGFEADTVGLDNPAAMQMGLDHLFQRGYRDLLLVSFLLYLALGPISTTKSVQDGREVHRIDIVRNLRN